MINSILNGDLFLDFEQNKYDGLIHGCNCFTDMQNGFARHVRLLYPEAYQADKNTIKGDKSKLGDYSFYESENGFILNIYSQFHGGTNFDLDAYINALKKINEDFKNKHFCMPKIGCGIGGSEWYIVEKATNEILKDVNITVYDFTPSNNSLY